MQVTYATHSPYFVEARHFHQIRRLTRSSEIHPGVTIHSATMEHVKTRLEGISKSQSIESQLDAVTAGALAPAIFATFGLVVEGTTDAAVIYGVGDRESPAKLEADGVAVVAADGKSRLPMLHAVLTELGIPTYALFDADVGYEVRARKQGVPEEKIEETRANNTTLNRNLLRYFGLPEEDFPVAAVSDSVAIFADNLESFLEAEWPEWESRFTAEQEASGMNLKKNTFAYRKVTQEAAGQIPELLNQILMKVNQLGPVEPRNRVKEIPAESHTESDRSMGALCSDDQLDAKGNAK